MNSTTNPWKLFYCAAICFVAAVFLAAGLLVGRECEAAEKPPSVARDVLIQDGTPVAYIVLPGHTGKGPLQTAAKDLAAYLSEMGGARFPIRRDWDWGAGNIPGFRILIGSTSLATVEPQWVSREKVGDDGFIIRSVPGGVVIAGNNDRGTVNGVYHFAEEVLGIHWWSMRETGPTISRRPTVAIAKLNITARPDFSVRINWLTIAAKYLPEEVVARNDDWSRFQRYGGAGGYAGHILYEMVPAGLFNTHPEYFPLIDGERRTQHPARPEHGLHNIQRCLSNPDVVRMAIQHTRDFFEEYLDLRWASISPNDGGGYCQCAECMATGPRPAHAQLAFANKVAKANEALFPNRGYAFLAYMGGSLDAPEGMKAHHNVFPIITPITQCRTHSILSDCPSCVRKREAIKGWQKVAERMGAYTYLSGGLYCTPTLEAAAEDIRFYRDHGCFSFRRENTAAPGAGWEMLVWVQAKLLWNADQDVEALRRRFIEGFYGERCADAVEKVFASMDGGVRNLPVTPLPENWQLDQHVHPHNHLPRQKIQPLIDAARSDILTALELAQKEENKAHRDNVLRDMGTLLGF